MSVAPHALPDVLPIGREVEATRLAHLIDDTVAGAKRAAVLLGAPGIGKSTLLRWARDRAEHRGAMAVQVRIPAAAGLPPRYPLGDVLGGFVSACERHRRSAPERLARAVASLKGAGAADSYVVDVPQIADALEEVGRSGPLAVFVDDYHWAPPDGIEPLIAALRVAETHVCFVASARLHGLGEEAATALPEPSADLWVEHLEVRGLEPAAVASLASSILGGEVLPSLADALYATTLGNPLYIVETIQAWRASNVLTMTAGFWGLDADSPPAHARSLREMIAARLRRLESEALAVAQSLAAIGRDVGFDELSAVSQVDESRLIDVLGHLFDEDVVTFDAHPVARYRLAHPLYAAALLDEEGDPMRAMLHGRIFLELRRRANTGHHASAAELAHHAVRALTPPADLRRVLRAAAEEAEAAGSFDEASIWYGHLAEGADDPRELVGALRGQATAAINVDPQRAVGLFNYALGLETEPPSRARLLLGRARAHRVAGHGEDALEDLQEALTLASEEQVFDIRHAMGALCGMLGRLDDAESIFRALALESSGSADHPKAIGHLGMVALIRGSVTEGTALMESALASCSDDSYSNYLRGNLAWLLVLLGRWDDAEAAAEGAIAHAVSSGDLSSECSVLAVGARLAVMRGDLAQGFDRATRAKRLALRLGNPADVITANDALTTALAENEMYEQAAALMDESLACDVPDIEKRELSYSFAVLTEACLLADDLVRARAALDRAEDHLPHAPFWAVAVDRCRAQIDLACDDPARALGHLRRWRDQPSEIVLERAHVDRIAARALLALGERDAASSLGEAALGTYKTLGAARMAERMGSWLDTVRAPKRGRPRSALPGHLTDRESEILRLVVLGRSNQGVADELFISIATVKKHLENIMAKAGVSRRTELVPFAISVGVLAAEDLVLEREAVRERTAGSAVPRPKRDPIAPWSVRPARGHQADRRASEAPER